LIREGGELSAAVFQRSGVSTDDVLRAIESRTTGGEPTSTGDDLPLSASTTQVFECAAQESERLLHHDVGPEHLLLGVFREGRSLAASILAERRLLINRVRDEIVTLLCLSPAMPPVRSTKLDIPPSTEVMIKPTERLPHAGVSARRASDYWVLEGVSLKDMLSRLSDIQTERIELPLSLDDDSRYHFLLVLPQRESRETIDRLMREGIEKYFHVRVAAELRKMEVYVLAAPNGAIRAMRTTFDEPGSFGRVEIQTPSALDDFIGFSDPLWRRDENETPTEDERSNMAGEFIRVYPAAGSAVRHRSVVCRRRAPWRTSARCSKQCSIVRSSTKRISRARTIWRSARSPEAAKSSFTCCAIVWGSRPRPRAVASQLSLCATPKSNAEASGDEPDRFDIAMSADGVGDHEHRSVYRSAQPQQSRLRRRLAPVRAIECVGIPDLVLTLEPRAGHGAYLARRISKSPGGKPARIALLRLR
jgi:hypothetical protein